MEKSPCKDCNDRNSTCHSNCEKYIEWDKQHKRYKDELAKKKAVVNQATLFEIESIRRAAKRRNGK